MIDINKIRIASPCSVPWETMIGDERTRLCSQCSLNVYNIADMSVEEIAGLISNSRGRKCFRLMRRADGTVITKDCPVGVRSYRKRIGKTAAAAFGTILGLFTVGYGQQNVPQGRETIIAKRITLNGNGVIKGVVTDSNGAVIRAVKIELYQDGRKKPIKTSSDKNGVYQFVGLPVGKFTITFKTDHFKKTVMENISITGSDIQTIDVIMEMTT